MRNNLTSNKKETIFRIDKAEWKREEEDQIKKYLHQKRKIEKSIITHTKCLGEGDRKPKRKR